MKPDWRSEWPFLVLLAGLFALAAANWSTAPDRIPIHWGLDGRVDRYGGKFEGLLMIPLVALFLYLLLSLVPLLVSSAMSRPDLARPYRILKWTVLLMVACSYAIVLLAMRGHVISTEAIVPVMLGALAIVIARVVERIEPNPLIGIRTPWTLSSQRAWTLTHRAAGRAFLIAGLLMAALGIARVPGAILIAALLLVATALGLCIYSYDVWRSDPERGRG